MPRQIVAAECAFGHPPYMEWMLGLSSWIIQDGNYGDFDRGDRFEAAVEFAFDAPTGRGLITVLPPGGGQRI